MSPAPSFASALAQNFLGQSPAWYKQSIVFFLLLNPLCLWLAGPVLTGWLLIAEFIFTLAMALKCYPLLPGGLLAIEALLLGLTTPDALYAEVEHNLPVILLLMFMVAGIYFMKKPAAGYLHQYSGAYPLQIFAGSHFFDDGGFFIGISRCVNRNRGHHQRRGRFLFRVSQGGIGQRLSTGRP